MDTKLQLRLNSFSVNDAGHIQCNRDGRAADERTAVLRIDLAQDSKAARDIVERLLAVVDEPRVLTGVSRNGSAVLLFRCDKNPVPYVQGSDSRTGVFEMATRAGVRFTIKCRSDDEAVDISAYVWPSKRSPLEVESFRLPVLTADIGAAVVAEAFKLGATWVSVVEEEIRSAARLAQFKADIASGKVKILTEAEREAAEDEEIAAGMPADISYSDGPLAERCLAARKRIANRKRLAKEAAAA